MFGKLLEDKVPLPTNSWCENLFLGADFNTPENKIFVVPYVIDTAGPIPGLRVHSANVHADDTQVIMNFEAHSGVTIGMAEPCPTKYKIATYERESIARLAVELEWKGTVRNSNGYEPSIRSPVVRGSPYGTVQYLHSTPLLIVERELNAPIIVDQGVGNKQLLCGVGKGNYSDTPVLVESELILQFSVSDHTWIVFLSEPTEFVCYQQRLPAVTSVNGHDFIPGYVDPNFKEAVAEFGLKAVKPMKNGMVRVALANNCTTGTSPVHCFERKPKDKTEAALVMDMLRAHADAYPTYDADVSFTFPDTQTDSASEQIEVFLNWKPALMSQLRNKDVVGPDVDPFVTPKVELLMFALPHHTDKLHMKIGSSNRILGYGCVPTLHGFACPVVGGSWAIFETLSGIDFHARRYVRPEMVSAIRKAVSKDLQYEIPLNYQKGAGDTYFSGKMVAKLARIILVAEEVGFSEASPLMAGAIARLRSSVEIWLNGSAVSPLVYDHYWGGVIGCGCNYDGEHSSCFNRYPDCPAMSDMGQNFGSGFYNDHHFHYGYHIYAAAVIMRYDAEWGRKYYEHVMALVRDIANPSTKDPYFPRWRHKDWFLGSSWASGIVTIFGKAYPNGRNEESSAEAIHAYEAVALFGLSAMNLFDGSANPGDQNLYQQAMLVKLMGRLLLGTEIRSAQRYWHVRAAAPGVLRVYPDAYASKVVGMLWSMLAQRQTWFGNEPWKSYGIQLMPITPACEERDDLGWIREMLPIFSESCSSDPLCEAQGWSVLVYASEASLCNWKYAWDGVAKLPDSVFLEAGGDGHSRSNTLWWIATRNCVD